METREVLQAVARREKLDQPTNQSTIKRLHREGYIEVCDVTHMQSPEREFLPTHLTEKGRRLLNAASHKP
jgi:DNA-binding MarR family transcriptional regulator